MNKVSSLPRSCKGYQAKDLLQTEQLFFHCCRYSFPMFQLCGTVDISTGNFRQTASATSQRCARSIQHGGRRGEEGAVRGLDSREAKVGMKVFSSRTTAAQPKYVTKTFLKLDYRRTPGTSDSKGHVARQMPIHNACSNPGNSSSDMKLELVQRICSAIGRTTSWDPRSLSYTDTHPNCDQPSEASCSTILNLRKDRPQMLHKSIGYTECMSVLKPNHMHSVIHTQARCLRLCRPSLSVISAAFIAF